MNQLENNQIQMERDLSIQTKSLKTKDSSKKLELQTCPICGTNFSFKPQLKNHIAAIHDGKKPNNCTICNYASFTKAKLKKHIKSVHDRKKPYECSACKKTFSQKEKIFLIKEKKQRHNIFGTWSTNLEKILEEDLNNNFRKVDLWADKIGCVYIEKDIKKENEFLNINTKEDLELAERIYSKK